VAIESARQSGRGDVPELVGPLALDEAIRAHAPGDALKLCLVPDATTSMARALGGWNPSRRIVLLVGPEGGLSFDEIASANQAGFVPTSLGPLVLRTELAATAALGALLGKLDPQTQSD
jgi:16S rRNA (uracil1498-N3)-methyltransferase